MKKIELSKDTKTNLKAFTITSVVVLIIVLILTILCMYPVEGIVIGVFLVILAFVGYFVLQIFCSIRDSIVEYQEKKEYEERRRAKGY